MKFMFNYLHFRQNSVHTKPPSIDFIKVRAGHMGQGLSAETRAPNGHFCKHQILVVWAETKCISINLIYDVILSNR